MEAIEIRETEEIVRQRLNSEQASQVRNVKRLDIFAEIIAMDISKKREVQND